MDELTLEILDKLIAQLPPAPIRRLKISQGDYDKMVQALKVVVNIDYKGTGIFPDPDMADGTYEFVEDIDPDDPLEQIPWEYLGGS